MKIQLVHPKHGEKTAYQEMEAELDKKNGWVEKIKEEKQSEPSKRRGRQPRVE